MQPTRIWKDGERLTIGYGGRTVIGQVKIASQNGQALAISFDALLGGYAGMMPVRWDEKEGVYRCLMLGAVVELREPDVSETRFHV